MAFMRSLFDRITGKITTFISWMMNRCTSVVIKVMVMILVLLVSFWLSLFLHLILVQILVPTKSFSWPAYLDLESDHYHLSSGNLTAVIPLAGASTSDTHCILPPRPRDDKKRHVREVPMPVCTGDPLATPALLARGQRYTVEVELVLPDSRPNRHHPMFQVQVAVLDARFSEISTSRRPLLVPYRSRVQRVASALLQVPSLLFVSSFPETHTLRTTVYDNYVDDPQRPARFIQLKLVRAVNLQVQSAHVDVHASFSGLRYMLYHYPLLCAALSTLVNMTLLLAALVVIYFKRQESLAQQRMQSLPDKATRLSKSQQLLQDDVKISSRDQVELPSPHKIDSGRAQREQTESSLLGPLAITHDEKRSTGENNSCREEQTSSLRKRSVTVKANPELYTEEKFHSLDEKAEINEDKHRGSFPTKGHQLPDEERDLPKFNESCEVKKGSSPLEECSLSCGDNDCFGSENKTNKASAEDASVSDAGILTNKSGEQNFIHEYATSSQWKNREDDGSENIQLEIPTKDKECDSSSTVTHVESSISQKEIEKENSGAEIENCSSSSDVEQGDCSLPSTEIEHINCSTSPPGSPVSTTSCDSRSSLGDFTVLN